MLCQKKKKHIVEWLPKIKRKVEIAQLLATQPEATTLLIFQKHKPKETRRGFANEPKHSAKKEKPLKH